ncbi:hypothetical protein [Streptococcus loxodontisalivarius]|uniref:DUF4209 domain-containing protein n=1 Tax=Streptococcus loxodontisalivarius TaxID=1349415 RepID=A0ABS2PQG0_9STRE|nr:hypothetical protein [Streptococcus loxodontisalivarius]MBM7642279.1 hypothetical protein [Streptococcus loxodontisalivarius]
MKQRVKFYSASDLSISFYFSRMEEIFSLYMKPSEILGDFADAIELENAIKIIESGSYSVNWTMEYLDEIKFSIPNLKKICKNFFGKASSELIQEYMLQLKDEYEYRDDFFEIFSKFDYSSKIPEDLFGEIFWQSSLSLRYLLKGKYFFKRYPNFIKETFLCKAIHLEILLSNFTDLNTENYFIPDNISKDEWNLLLEDYIHDRESNLNYLRLLLRPIRGLGKGYFTITDKQKLEIQNISNAFNENFDKSDFGPHVIYEVYTDKENYKQKSLEYKSLSSLTMAEMIDKSILNNIMRSAGEQVDEQLTLYMISLIDRIKLASCQESEELFTYLSKDRLIFSEKNMLLLPSFPHKETLVISSSIGVSTKNSYNSTQYFQIKQQQVSCHIIEYQRLLREFNSSLEKIVHWYFSDYSSMLGVKWLPFTFSPEDDAIDNKISTIFKNEEKIRKQYKLLIENSEVDQELYNLQEVTPSFESLPSFISKKYAYVADNQQIQKILEMLFSDQSHLICIDKNRYGKTLVELINSHMVKKGDFLNYQQVNIQFLIDNGILSDDEDKLSFVDDKEIELLKELYWFSDVSYINASDDERKMLDELSDKGMIEFGSSLFSRSESDYLNYLVNNSKFDNSLGVRNKYQHGSPAYKTEQQYNLDYSIALLILIICVVKINEEMMLKQTMEKRNSNEHME